MLDIQSGQILVSKVVKHKEDLKTIRNALEELAEKLTGQIEQIDMTKLAPVEDLPVRQLPPEQIKKDSNRLWWTFAAIAVAVIGVAVSVASDSTNTSGSDAPPDLCPSGPETCGTVEYTW